MGKNVDADGWFLGRNVDAAAAKNNNFLSRPIKRLARQEVQPPCFLLRCSTLADLQTCRLADMQTCRLADLQTCRLADCRLADLQTFVTSTNHVTLDNKIVTRIKLESESLQ